MTTLPSIGLPSTTLPSTGLPSTTLPSTTLPSTTLPSTTLPSTTLPSTTLPWSLASRRRASFLPTSSAWELQHTGFQRERLAMSDDLDAFREAYEGDDAGAATGLLQRALLVFQLGSEQYAVEASSVDAVIPWRQPVPLPRASVHLAGVIQDRGRIVAILNDPLGRPRTDEATRARIVVCATPWGFVGLPASATRVVGSVVIAAEPRAGATVDSAEGPLTYIDLRPVVETLRGAAP